MLSLSSEPLSSLPPSQCWEVRRRRKRRKSQAHTEDIPAIEEVTIRDLDTTATVTTEDDTQDITQALSEKLQPKTPTLQYICLVNGWLPRKSNKKQLFDLFCD